MSYALVDNASLTSAQRLLGRIEIRGSGSTDGDIAAFEGLVQAILFYHEVVCVDDYKAEHRLSREKQFSFIRFLDPREFSLQDVDKAAAEEARAFKPEIRGGEFADKDFKNFFDQLKVNIICTWDISASIYYLTMKMLGQPNTEEFSKYAQISATIFGELTDQINRGDSWNNNVSLVDSKGRPIGKDYVIEDAKWGGGNTGGLSPSLKTFVAALNWLARRTLYYSFVARHLRADTFLHPIRSGFQIHYMQKTGAFGYDFTRALLGSFDVRSKEALTAIISGSRSELALKLDLPLFSAWLVRESGDIKTVLASALSLREQPEFVDARYEILQIREAVDNDDIKVANEKARKISERLDKVLQAIRKRYGMKSTGGVVLSPIIQVFNTIGAFKGWPKIPELKAKVPIPTFIEKSLPQKGLVQVYRNIVSDLPTIWKLGEIKKMLTKAVRANDERAFVARLEEPQYRRAHSQWKSPM